VCRAFFTSFSMTAILVLLASHSRSPPCAVSAHSPQSFLSVAVLLSCCWEVTMFVRTVRNVVILRLGKARGIWRPEPNFVGTPGQNSSNAIKPGSSRENRVTIPSLRESYTTSKAFENISIYTAYTKEWCGIKSEFF
jgi:hypothetical protein